MKLLLLFTLCGVLSGVLSDGQYSIIAPGTLHSKAKYSIAVALHNNKESALLKVGLTGSDLNEVKTIELQPNEIKDIEFDIPFLKGGEYQLFAEGLKGIVFKNTSKLNFEEYSGNIKILTDRGIYKPGDTVNFRVLFLDENLKPTEAAKGTVIGIKDGKDHVIKEFKHFELVQGVFTGKFAISDHVNLGSWKLFVSNDYTYQVNSFQVGKYILPKFQVTIDDTGPISLRDGDISIVVKAHYLYGRPVEGKANITIVDESHSSEGLKTQKLASKIVDLVNGKAKFDVNLKAAAWYLTNEPYSYVLTAVTSVEEKSTGMKIDDSRRDFSIYPYRYVYHCVTACQEFVEDKETDIVMKVSLVDGTPITDTKSKVKLTLSEVIWEKYVTSGEMTTTPKPTIEEKKFNYESQLNATGFAVFKVKLPALAEIPDYEHFYEMEFEYLDEKRKIGNVHQQKKEKETAKKTPQTGKQDFEVVVNYPEERKDFTLKDTITATVKSNIPFKYFIYNLVARGNIIKHERIDLPNAQTMFDLTIKPTFTMSPYLRIYAYYVDEQGELHYAETSIYIQKELENSIDISAPQEVKPGADVPLHIKTLPHSFVGLTAIDQSLQLLGESNALNYHDALLPLGCFDTTTPWLGGSSIHPGEESGVITMTNAEYYYNWTKPKYDFSPVERPDDCPRILYSPANADGKRACPMDINLRKDFSQTWIFDNIEDTQTEEFTWSKKIPDTLTSWVLNGFSINPSKGLGITHEQVKVTTFQPFFVAVRLPHSVKRGEVLNILALVFNYLDKDLDVQVTLDNSDDEYDFTDAHNEIINEPKRTKTVRVPSQSTGSVSFMIKPKIVGNVMIKLGAISPIAGDAIFKVLKVEPEGVTEYGNRVYFFNLKETNEIKESFKLELPADVVADSTHIEVEVNSDLLGPVLNNLNNFVRLPKGGAEQTTSSLETHNNVLRYLKHINKLTPALEEKIKQNLESGYQRVLSSALSDGSFAFFDAPPSKDENAPSTMTIGSTWMTAYIVRTLGEITPQIQVYSELIDLGLKFLASQQREDGSFDESYEFLGGTYRNRVSLTANALRALLHNETLAKSYKDPIDKALKFIANNVDQEKDLHVKAVALYALNKAKHSLVPRLLAELKTLAKTEDGRQWWSDLPKPLLVHWWSGNFNTDIETTAYMLLTLLDQPDTTAESAVPIVTWLMGQRNSRGGFKSTQDTVIGLQALIEFAKKANYESAAMEINVKATGGKVKEETIKVNENSELVPQSLELPANTNVVDFVAKGKGAAVIQIAYHYNLVEKEKNPSFNIKPVINKETMANKLKMNVCVGYTGDKEASNLAILEITLPSGYLADEESFKEMLKVPQVQQVETKDSNSMIVVYFESLHKQVEQCVPVEALKEFAVAQQKPASIVMYDYFNATAKATEYYEVASKVCDICEDDEECQKACK